MTLRADIDTGPVLAALRRLGSEAQPRLREVSLATGRRVADEARGRVARRTGQTAAAITVDEDNGVVRVYVAHVPRRSSNVPLWLEFGTWKMRARPFLLVSAQLEAPGHLSRVAAALDTLLSEVGG
jgi:hypothetical protein